MEGARVSDVPAGIRALRSLTNLTATSYQASVLGVTFLAYACYHATRKPISIVKSVLHPEDYLSVGGTGAGSPAGWPPFIGKQGKARLGIVDVSFLAAYAGGMFFAGHLGDRLNLRLFLTGGMMLSALFTGLFGMAYWWKIHSLGYFVLVQILAGILQSTGWPSVVSAVANWCSKSKRGIIMGVWNCHTSVGNIVGSLVAAEMLSQGWGWSFVAPAILMALGALLVFFFLVVEPQDVGVGGASEAGPSQQDEVANELTLLNQPHSMAGKFQSVMIDHSFKDVELGEQLKEVSLASPAAAVAGPAPARNESVAIGFLEAWRIPGVAQFALCLFFSKLVAYTFLYWLPFYVRHTRMSGEYLSDNMAGRFSALFDVGGMLGGVLAGYVSDYFKAKATTAAAFLYISIPALLLYRMLGGVSLAVNIVLMMLLGVFVNGPYALITTAVSADLGTHSSLNGNSKALATVTAIIDGTGSVGAAVGPLLTGFISEAGWDAVFAMLVISMLVAGLLLTKQVSTELSHRLGTSGAQFERLEPDEATGTSGGFVQPA